MLQTYKTILTEKKQLTDDVYLYKFKLINPPAILFIPGQYVILFVPQENKEPARRLYSIASPNTRTDEFELLVKLIPNGVASAYLSNMKIDDEITFQGPAGMFILRESPRDKIFMVTGTGYAPVRSMLLSISNLKTQNSKLQLKTQNEPLNSYLLTPNYYLLIGFPYYKDVFLFDELKALQSSIFNLKSFICLSREQNLDMIPEKDKKYFLLGRVTNGFEQLISTNFNQFQPISNADFYLCSGRDVVESLKQYLYQKGAPKEQVYFEKF